MIWPRLIVFGSCDLTFDLRDHPPDLYQLSSTYGQKKNTSLDFIAIILYMYLEGPFLLYNMFWVEPSSS